MRLNIGPALENPEFEESSQEITVITPDGLRDVLSKLPRKKSYPNKFLLENILDETPVDDIWGAIPGILTTEMLTKVLDLDAFNRDIQFRKLIKNPMFWKTLPLYNKDQASKDIHVYDDNGTKKIRVMDFLTWLCDPEFPERFSYFVTVGFDRCVIFYAKNPDTLINLKEETIKSVNRFEINIGVTMDRLWEMIDYGGEIFNWVNISIFNGLLENWLSRGLVSQDLLNHLKSIGIIKEVYGELLINQRYCGDQDDEIPEAKRLEKLMEIVDLDEIQFLLSGVVLFSFARGGRIPTIMALRGILSKQMSKRLSSIGVFAKVRSLKFWDSFPYDNIKGIRKDAISRVIQKINQLESKHPTLLIIDSPGKNKDMKRIPEALNRFAKQVGRLPIDESFFVTYTTSRPYDIEKRGSTIMEDLSPKYSKILSLLDDALPFAGQEFQIISSEEEPFMGYFSTLVERFIGRRKGIYERNRNRRSLHRQKNI